MVKQPIGRPRASVIKQGDLYWVNLNPTAGHEQKGYRPVLVISQTGLNQLLNGVVTVLPITNHGNFIRRSKLGVPLEKPLKTTGIVIICYPRSLDFRARQTKFIETLPPHIFFDIVNRFKVLF